MQWSGSMKQAILYKIQQRQLRFRNPEHLTVIHSGLMYSEAEYRSAQLYLEELEQRGICYTHPNRPDYPALFLRMKEPPLFFEYVGSPLWLQHDFLSVVGSRDIGGLTESWMKKNLEEFLRQNSVGIVSGGAHGVDQLAHTIAIKNNRPTIFVLPSGLVRLYPVNLKKIKEYEMNANICFISEFEFDQPVVKTNFYVRNRLIAALGLMTLVTQASLRSGSLLTVHHALEIGRPVMTVPSHPDLIGFEANLKLLHEGAAMIKNSQDLHEIWKAESWT